MHHVSTLCLGGHLLRYGSGLLALGLISALGFILHYFYVTPFEVCSAALATVSVFDVWPWALPLLATEGLAVTLIASGLCLISQATRESAFKLSTREGGSCHDAA
ncbi:hypothetical protein CN186_29470 [Sinorhizobium medicae]|uniref:hypothetical protein n=1 Tax=Sinorhizobium medicae TaxID=110321 RepID=UPI000FD956DC|nr:hypothetical protein [Sinorhizobium medicae]RVI87938.1 hypothetical protein CN186_29470 [Sinorhizobium medicae]